MVITQRNIKIQLKLAITRRLSLNYSNFIEAEKLLLKSYKQEKEEKIFVYLQMCDEI